MKVAFLTDSYMPQGRSLDPFRAQLLKHFIATSSELLYIQTNDYQDDRGNFKNRRAKEHVLGRLATFQPHLVFSLNRAGLTTEVAAVTSAPIASWYIDNPNRFPETLRNFSKNETLFCATHFQREWLKRNHPSMTEVKYLPFCTDESIFFPESQSSTAIRCDVSFVGTLWDPNPFLEIVSRVNQSQSDKQEFTDRLGQYLKDYHSDFPQWLSQRIGQNDPIAVKNFLDDFLSSRKRLNVLNALSDLDLEIYGTLSWNAQALLKSDALFRRFQTTPIESPTELAALYRRTRVAVSIAHHQAQTGFPIRVFDIFASGIPLVSDPHEEIDELFGSDGAYLKARSPEEYSENVRRLLSDKALAARLAQNSLNEVLARHTFRHRVEAITGQRGDRVNSTVTLVSERLDPSFLATDPRLKECQYRFHKLSQGASTPWQPPPPASATQSPFRKISKGLGLWLRFHRQLLVYSWQFSKGMVRSRNPGKGLRQSLDWLDLQIRRMKEECP